MNLRRKRNIKKDNLWHSSTPMLINSFAVFWAVLFIITGCGGGVGSWDEDNGGEDESINEFIHIGSYYTYRSENNKDYVVVRGTAFVASKYVAHKCGGLGCIIGSYDNSYPGVDVSWHNRTSNRQGDAGSRYGTATDWEHYWSATIPILPGNNSIDFIASDWPGTTTYDTSISFEYFLPPPRELITDTDDMQITLTWDEVPDATSYNVYWSNVPGVSRSTGTKIDEVTSPFIHSGLKNGMPYHYIVTALYNDFEGMESFEVTATAGAPPQPAGLTVEISNSYYTEAEAQVSWDIVGNAESYNIYWANEPDNIEDDGTKVDNVDRPYVHKEMKGMTYYFSVTAVNAHGESLTSQEVMIVPPVRPPAPTGLFVEETGYSGDVKVQWDDIPGTRIYEVFRCPGFWHIDTTNAWDEVYCHEYWQTVYKGTEPYFIDSEPVTSNCGFGWYYVRVRLGAPGTTPDDSERSEPFGYLSHDYCYQ